MAPTPFAGNWMVAVAEAAAVAGAADLETASWDALTKAWDLVSKATDVTRAELAKRIAEQAGLAVADLRGAQAHAARLVPPAIARARHVMPLRCSDKEIVVATANPLSHETKRELGRITSRAARFEIAPPVDIQAAVLQAYGKPMPGEASSRVAPEEFMPEGPHVLIVDDEAGVRALFRSILEEAGFRVSLARDGVEAMEILGRGERFDLITLDYFMDRMNGLKVLQQVRSKPALSMLPVIMVTGADDRRIEMSLFEAGADDFVVKPIDAPLFILRIQAALRRRQLR